MRGIQLAVNVTINARLVINRLRIAFYAQLPIEFRSQVASAKLDTLMMAYLNVLYVAPNV